MKCENPEDVAKVVRRLARNIKAKRKSLNLTQTDMSEFGFGARWYQRLESGSHVPTIPTLCKLAAAFKVEVSEFFE